MESKNQNHDIVIKIPIPPPRSFHKIVFVAMVPGCLVTVAVSHINACLLRMLAGATMHMRASTQATTFPLRSECYFAVLHETAVSSLSCMSFTGIFA